MFTLHPQLAADTVPVSTLSLCQVLLAKDSRYPWLILVPQKPDLRELHDLTEEDYSVVMAEIRAVSKRLADHFKADKMNVAALGNMVPQLHIHIIARFKTDEAWPGPIWGIGEARPYPAENLSERLEALHSMLEGL